MNTAGESSIAQERKRVPVDEIRLLVDQIAEQTSVKKVILFGSYAQGKPGAESDVDLLVVTDTPGGADASLRMRLTLNYAFALDLLVYEEKILAERIKAGDFFLQDAVESGKVLYERPHR